jgi:hypothetical protein
MRIHVYALCISLVLAFMCDAPITQAQDTLASLKRDAAQYHAIRMMAWQIVANNPGLVLPVNKGER